MVPYKYYLFLCKELDLSLEYSFGHIVVGRGDIVEERVEAERKRLRGRNFWEIGDF